MSVSPLFLHRFIIRFDGWLNDPNVSSFQASLSSSQGRSQRYDIGIDWIRYDGIKVDQDSLALVRSIEARTT